MAAVRAPLLVAIAVMAPLALSGATSAQAPKETPAHRTVKMFNVFCLSQLPDLDGVAKAAGFGEFAPLAQEELAAYAPKEPVDELHVWQFHEPAGRFTLTAQRGSPDEETKRQAPAFADATRYACALTFPPTDAQALQSELAALFKRAADETRADGAHRVHAWRQTAAKHLSRVALELSAPSAPGRLSASVLVKP